jgi:Cys-rich repeat protein
LVLGTVFSACSDGTGGGAGDGGTGLKRGLIILGQATVKTVPRAEHELRVFLYESGSGGAKGIAKQDLNFTFIGNAGGTQLESASVVTDVDGRGTARLTVGDSAGAFQVQAAASAFSDVVPVAFSFDVVGLGRNLKVVGDQEKNVWTQQKVTLTVKLTQVDYTKPKAPEQPVQGEEVTFTIQKADNETITARFEDTGNNVAASKTTLSGNGSVVFYTGEDVRSYYVNVSVKGASSLDIKVNVNRREGGQVGCVNSKDCSQGEVCVDGTCTPGDWAIPCDAETPCPEGYECINGECQHTTSCPEGYHLEPGGPGGAPTCVPNDPNQVGCKTDADCKDANMYCDGGVCKPLRPSCDSDKDCPSGYICLNNDCVPKGDKDCQIASDCPQGQICKNGKCSPCVLDDDCPSGFLCISGVCDTPPQCGPYENEDVGGLWYTTHEFDLSDALLGLPKIAEPLDFIDQVFKGNLGDIGDIPIIGPIIEGLVQDLIRQYVPPWVPDLVHALNSLANLFEVMKVEGEMQLWHLNPHELINGKEEWQSVILHWIDQCPEGRQDPNYPSCAEMDIINLKDANIQMKEVKNFTGRVDCDMLYIDDREVEMEMYKLVNLAVDMVVQIVTGYDTLEEAVEYMIDCAEVQTAADDLACDLSDGSVCSVPGVEVACDAAKATLPKAFTDWLAKQGVPTTFTFHGHAKIVDDQLDKYADHLVDGVWEGEVKVLFDGDLNGTWSAER